MKNLIKRNPQAVLPLSIRFAKDYLNELCKMQSKIVEVEESKYLTTIHRALWTALIIEVGRIFDRSENVISFKKIPIIEDGVNRFNSEAIIGKIIRTRNTFTAHFSVDSKEIVSATEICNSNLGKILDGLSNSLETINKYP